MEFFNQGRENQRKNEHFVIILFTVYAIGFSIGVIKMKWDMWIPVTLTVLLAVGWTLFLTKYRNPRVRAVITTVMIHFTVIMYAMKVVNLFHIIPFLIAISVLIAFYGYVELLWGTIISLLFLAFYHCVITGAVWNMPEDARMLLFCQLGNIFSVEFVLYALLKSRKERNEQVYEIIEALMDAEQSKDDFLSNVSHEIRTPVNTICGMSEMALREHDLEKMREEVFDIRDAGHNLMSLVTDILDFSQLQQGKMNLEEEAYNITSTINDIINIAMARKGDKQIELIVDCDSNIPSGLFGDEKKIRRVIMNLVDNAIKFTNEGGVIIRIYTRKENYGVNLCISVKDTGIGIKEESLEKLFESFSQVDTRRNRQKGGVGLGLAISKELIQKMGGTITVKSRLGKGSTFRFVVPQKVLDEKPIGEIENRETLNIAAYFDMEQFDMMTIRDEYTELITNMISRLRVRCHVCRNLAELMRREGKEAFTHIFISLEEYQEDMVYFDTLAKHTKIIIVIDRPREKYLSNPDLIRLYKPFYILPVVSILNGSSGSEGGKQITRPGKFSAPDAHVLVVDDNRMNIRVVEGLLKEYKIKVTYATSGQEALELIENMSYDFVFMDHMMPEMDGVETLHRIRDKVGHYYQGVPIIALTANAAPGNREMFLAEGFDDFVSKPLELSVLERVLRRNLPEEKLVFSNEVKEQEQPDRRKYEEQPDGKKIEEQPDGKKIEEQPDVRKIEEHTDGRMHEEQPDGRKIEERPGKTDEFAVGDLDIQKGMLYCGGQQEYRQILAAYYAEREENARMIVGLYEKQDWKNYTIKVHAIKSMMQNIGASPLAAKAKALEMAGKRNDFDYIRKNHNDMMKEYDRVMEEIEQSPFIDTTGEAGANGQAANLGSLETQKDATGLEIAGAGEAKTGMAKAEMEMPDLSEEAFDELAAKLEDAMFALDGEEMLAVLEKMQIYSYHQTPLSERLSPIRKKIEMSDYMSAVDMLSRIRQELKAGMEGGACGS